MLFAKKAHQNCSCLIPFSRLRNKIYICKNATSNEAPNAEIQRNQNTHIKLCWKPNQPSRMKQPGLCPDWSVPSQARVCRRIESQRQLLPTSLIPAFQESSSNTISHRISSPAVVSNISAFVLSLHIIFSYTHRTWAANPIFCNVMRFFFVISTNQDWEQLRKEILDEQSPLKLVFQAKILYLKQN